MPRKRTAADAELRAVARPLPAPPSAPLIVPTDVLRVIFEFVLERRHTAVWRESAEGLVFSVWTPAEPAVHTIPVLRLVCKQWARVAGTLVSSIMAPDTFREGPISLAAAFPLVTRIRTNWKMGYPKQHWHFEAVLRDYASLGTLASVSDERVCDCYETSLPCLNVHGLFVMRGRVGKEGSYLNAGLGTNAWPCRHDRTRLYAAFGYGSRLEHFAAALVRAHCVEFQELAARVVCAQTFRARALAFNLLDVHPDGSNVAELFPFETIRDLLRPERWEDARLPDVYITAPAVDLIDERRIVDIAFIAAAVAPIVPSVFTHYPAHMPRDYPRVFHRSKYKELVG